MSTESASAQIEYRHPTTVPSPGPLACKLLAPLPRLAWPGLALAGLVPCVALLGAPLTPNYLYMWPAVAICGFLISATPLAGVGAVHDVVRTLLARRYHISPSPQRGRPRAWIAGLVVYWLVFGTPVAMTLGFIARRGAFEDVRQRVTAGAMPVGPTTILPFRVHDTERQNDGLVIVYTEGTRGDFPGGGSGFLYLPDGAPFPQYNEGSDGHVVGRWYWFVTD